MYNPNSMIATEFIDHQEILDSLAYAEANKSNYALIDSLIERAADCKGLSHREAAVLLECDIPELNEKMYTLAKKIKQQINAFTLRHGNHYAGTKWTLAHWKWLKKLELSDMYRETLDEYMASYEEQTAKIERFDTRIEES